MKISTIESMIKSTLKEPGNFNFYPYHEKAVCNQFFFALDGYFYSTKQMIVRIVPKIYWEKKKLFFTQEINLNYFLGDKSQDLNGTGSWLLPDFPSDPLDCAKLLTEKGFIWSQSLQEAVNEEPSDDGSPLNFIDFQAIPPANIATEINKTITPEIELEIFENRLNLFQDGLQKGLLNFYKIIRTPPITKEKTLLNFLKKYNIPYDAKIDSHNNVDIMSTACWLDKSLIVQYYVRMVPKNLVDEYGRSLVQIAQDYKSFKSEKILLENGFQRLKNNIKPGF